MRVGKKCSRESQRNGSPEHNKQSGNMAIRKKYPVEEKDNRDKFHSGKSGKWQSNKNKQQSGKQSIGKQTSSFLEQLPDKSDEQSMRQLPGTSENN